MLLAVCRMLSRGTVHCQSKLVKKKVPHQSSKKSLVGQCLGQRLLGVSDVSFKKDSNSVKRHVLNAQNDHDGTFLTSMKSQLY